MRRTSTTTPSTPPAPVSPPLLPGQMLAPVSDLLEYGAVIVAELDRAEADLDNANLQPFSGMSPVVMRDIVHLRNRQFDMFRRHVDIERAYKIEEDGARARASASRASATPAAGSGATSSAAAAAVADGEEANAGAGAASDDAGAGAGAASGGGNDGMTFSGIAMTMRKKESATAGLLNRLADFDAQLRQVMDTFESDTSAPAGPLTEPPSAAGSGGARVARGDRVPPTSATPASRAMGGNDNDRVNDGDGDAALSAAQPPSPRRPAAGPAMPSSARASSPSSSPTAHPTSPP